MPLFWSLFIQIFLWPIYFVFLLVYKVANYGLSKKSNRAVHSEGEGSGVAEGAAAPYSPPPEKLNCFFEQSV